MSRYPEKDKARRIAQRAIHSGVLVRPTRCDSCGIKCKPDAHHSDYTLPLCVEFLCKPCHGKRHRGPRGRRSDRVLVQLWTRKMEKVRYAEYAKAHGLSLSEFVRRALNQQANYEDALDQTEVST